MSRQALLLAVYLTALTLATQYGCGGNASHQNAGSHASSTDVEAPSAECRQAHGRIRDLAQQMLGSGGKRIDPGKPLTMMQGGEEVLIYLGEAVTLVTSVEIMFDVNISKEELGGTDEDYRRVTVNKLAEIVCRKKGL